MITMWVRDALKKKWTKTGVARSGNTRFYHLSLISSSHHTPLTSCKHLKELRRSSSLVDSSSEERAGVWSSSLSARPLNYSLIMTRLLPQASAALNLLLITTSTSFAMVVRKILSHCFMLSISMHLMMGIT